MSMCIGRSPQVFSVYIWSSFKPQTKPQIQLASRGASPIQHCIRRHPHRSKQGTQNQPSYNTVPTQDSRATETRPHPLTAQHSLPFAPSGPYFARTVERERSALGTRQVVWVLPRTLVSYSHWFQLSPHGREADAGTPDSS